MLALVMDRRSWYCGIHLVRKSPQELPIRAAVVSGPRLKAPFAVEPVGKVDVGLAVQQVPKIDSRSFQVHGVDLEVAPIERSVGVVMKDLALAAGIFGTLNCQCDPACRSELVASVLLVRRQAAAELIGLRFDRIFRGDSWCNDQRPLESQA